MKKTIFVLFLLLSLGGTRQASASAIAGALEPTQWLNNFELVGVNIEGATTAIEQTLSTVKQTIMDPIATGLIAVAQKQATDSVIAWANGGFSGTPLIVTNPENFIKQAGLNSVKSTLSKIPTDSVLGDSIFNSILTQNKDISIATKLKELSKSPTASIIQKTNCDDPATLMDKAMKQAEDEGGTPDEILDNANQYYQELNAAICEGDPNTDPAVAKKLDTLAANNPSLGGWDLWLTSTSVTPQQKIAEASRVADAAVKTQYDTAQAELQGVSAISQKECVKEITYEDGSKGCDEWATTNPGKAVQDALSKAALAPIDRLSSLTGADGLMGVLTGFITSALTKGLNTAFTSSKTTGSNTSVTTGTRAPAVNDLANNPDAKASLTGPMLRQLNTSSDSLTKLDTLDNQYLSDMNTYESRINSGRSCYDSLVSDYPSFASNGTVSSAYALFNERQGRVNAVRNSITPEKAKIVDALALINATKTKLSAANSTEAVSSLYNEYADAVEKGNYPTTVTEAKRRAEYQRAKSEAERDNDLNNAINNCSSLRQSQGYGEHGD